MTVYWVGYGSDQKNMLRKKFIKQYGTQNWTLRHHIFNAAPKGIGIIAFISLIPACQIAMRKS